MALIVFNINEIMAGTPTAGAGKTAPLVTINMNHYNPYGFININDFVFKTILDIPTNSKILSDANTAVRIYLSSEVLKLYDPNLRKIEEIKLPKANILEKSPVVKSANDKQMNYNIDLTTQLKKVESDNFAQIKKLYIKIYQQDKSDQINIERTNSFGAAPNVTSNISNDDTHNNSFEATREDINAHKVILKIKLGNPQNKKIQLEIYADLVQKAISTKTDTIKFIVNDESLIFDDISFAKGNSKCTPTFCTHANIPLAYQLDQKFYELLESSYGQSFERSGPDWMPGKRLDDMACGAVAGGMMLNGFGLEQKEKGQLFSNLNYFQEISVNNSDKQAKISAATGSIFKTNYQNRENEKNTGTLLKNIRTGLQGFLTKTLNVSNLEMITDPSKISQKGIVNIDRVDGSSQAYINKILFYDKMPHLMFLISNEPSKWGHFVTWIGYENESHIVFDPYKRISKFNISVSGALKSTYSSGSIGHNEKLRIIGVSGINLNNSMIQRSY